MNSFSKSNNNTGVNSDGSCCYSINGSYILNADLLGNPKCKAHQMSKLNPGKKNSQANCFVGC